MKLKKKGFTLIELIIVIAIIGILAAIAIPKYNESRRIAANTAHNSNVQMLRSAAQLRQTAGIGNNITIIWPEQKDDALKYVEKWPEIPAGADVSGQYIVTITKDSINVEPGEIEVKN